MGARWDGASGGKQEQGGTKWDRVTFSGVGQHGTGGAGIREPWHGSRQQAGPPSQAREWWDGGDFPFTSMEKMSAMKPRQKKLQNMVLKKDQTAKSRGLWTGSVRTEAVMVGRKVVAGEPAL